MFGFANNFMSKFIDNVNYKLFSQRKFYWFLLILLILILSLLFHLYILPIQLEVTDIYQQSNKPDKVISWIDHQDVKLISSLSAKQIKNFNHVLYIISLDGKITAIDVRKNGHQIWIADTGAPLVDSTISKVEISRDSKSTRLVPSLHGGLYRLYDENERMEPLPFDVESLLNTSFQSQDELIMTGGRYIDTIGLDLHTGKTIYSFLKDDGDQSTSGSTCSSSMLMIKRIRQIVRARCMRSGQEKWNFSVSNHELIHLYVPSSDDIHKQYDGLTENQIYFEYQLQTGLILAFDYDTNNLLWTSSINNPIAAVWELKNGQLKEKSLLKTRHTQRIAFMGKFNSMPYIIISSQIQRQLIYNTRKATGISSSNMKVPVLSFWHKTNLKGPLSIDYETRNIKEDLLTNDQDYPLAIRQTQIWDNLGYLTFLEPDENIIDEEKHELSADVTIKSTWRFPLEISSICLGLLTLIFIWYPKRRNTNIDHQSLIVSEDKNIPSECSFSEPTFQSRYMLEYEHIRFLGRGGFGVVFESINKLDQRRVAIKRVPLKKLSTKDRALKEIRCLAILNHPNLIQYYYAWHESAPNGWQDEKDKHWMMTSNDLTKDSLSLVSTSALSNENTESIKQLKSNELLSTSYLSPVIDFTFERSLNRSHLTEDSNSSLFEHSYDSSKEESSENDSKILSHQSTSTTEDFESNYPITYFYFVMELCQPESLRNRLMKQIINSNEAWSIFNQILNGIEYIHSKKLIHRDLKPSNILFSMDNTVKIGDFGLVSAFGEEKNDSIENNELGGTKLYMSPEQISRQSYNQKVDIYAIGIILFELLYPFSTQMERIRTLENIRLQTPTFPNDFQHNQSIHHLICWLLAYTPHDRPKACELRQDSSYQNILKEENVLC